MKSRLIFVLVVWLTLLLVGCTTGQQDPMESTDAFESPRGGAIQPGPGLWPTGMPAPPSPSATPPTVPKVPTAPIQGSGSTGELPSRIPSTDTVATSTAPGWTIYESINDIRDLAFAPDGTLWAATTGGLVRWGLEAQTGGGPGYARYPLYASAIATAPDGSLWLALEQGLCLFTGNACELYTKADGLLGDHVYAIVVDQDGIVWAGTEQGVSRFDGETWKSYPSPVATHDLAVTADGEIWAATAGGVSRYLLAEDGWITYTEGHGLPSSNAQVIAAGPDGEIWAYLTWQGLYRFDGAQWQEIEGAEGLISDMAFASDGTPWFSTAGGTHYPGGSLFYRDGERWIDVANGQGLNSFRTVALGPDDVVAVSTQLGLGLYEGGEWRLLGDGPASDRVTSVAVTPDGAAWFAFGDLSVSTPGRGLSRFGGQRWDYFLDDGEVNALAVGPDGSPWAGVGCSVWRFDGTAWKTAGGCEDLPTGNVTDIGFEPEGVVWVATGLGLARFDGRSWVHYEKPVHSLEIAPDGTLWVNGWEGTQGSNYVARFDGETWEQFYAGDAYPGGFVVGAVTSDGLLWGITPEGELASYDGRSWADAESWRFYEPPGGVQEQVALLGAAPDGALWLAMDESLARFDHVRPIEEAWTIYTQNDGLPEHYNRSLAFGPRGEIWLGATRFQPDLIATSAGTSTAAPSAVEAALPVAASEDTSQPAPYCRPSEAFLEISVPDTHLEVGEILTVTVTLANGDEGTSQLGLIQFSLGAQPEVLVVGNLEPVEHSSTILPGDSDQAQFVLRAVAPGKMVLSASASYEIHATDYSWASWSGCDAYQREITIVP